MGNGNRCGVRWRNLPQRGPRTCAACALNEVGVRQALQARERARGWLAVREGAGGASGVERLPRPGRRPGGRRFWLSRVPCPTVASGLRSATAVPVRSERRHRRRSALRAGHPSAERSQTTRIQGNNVRGNRTCHLLHQRVWTARRVSLPLGGADGNSMTSRAVPASSITWESGLIPPEIRQNPSHLS